MRLVALLLVLLACEPPGPRYRAYGNPTPRDGGTLRLSTVDSVKTLDPAYAYDETTYYALHAIFDTLLAFGDGTQVVPGLAERWELAADGRQYRFTLRAGLRYADGSPIVAADVAFALARVQAAEDSPFRPFLDGVVAIEAPGERELVVELAQPNSAFVYVFTMKFTAPQRARAGDMRREPLATGPYMVASWDEGQRLELVRNPHYHDRSRQRLERIELRENLAPDTQFLLFERGELDLASRLTAPDFLWVSGNPAWRPHVHTRPVMNVFGARMNVTRPPFDDRRVRQALNYALDKQSIVKLTNGTAVPSHGLLPPGAFGRDDALAPYPHDPAKARALLAAAGHAHLVLDYVTWPDELAQKLALSMQADFAAVGVTLNIVVMSPAAWQTAVGAPDGPPFSIATWIGDFPDPTSFLDAKLHSRGIDPAYSVNDSFYKNAALDALLDRARGERDPATRAALYRQAERIVLDDAPWLFGYHQLATELVQPYVQGYSPHPIWVRDVTTAWLDLAPDGSRVAR